MIFGRWMGPSDKYFARFQADAATTGERIVAGPEKAIYRGSTTYGSVKGNGRIVLTDQRLLFRKITGGIIDVPTSKVVGSRQSKSFRRSRVGGQTHFVVITDHPDELGFFVRDRDLWERACKSLQQK